MLAKMFVGRSEEARRAQRSRLAGYALRLAQHRVGADSTPDHMRFSGQNLGAILERRATIRGKCDLPDTRRPLNAMDTQSGREYRWILLESSDEDGEHREKCPLQLARQPTELSIEASKPLERGHAYADGSTSRSSSLAATRSRCAANSPSRNT